MVVMLVKVSEILRKSPQEAGGKSSTQRKRSFRVCLKIARGAVFEQRAGWRGATRENTLHGSSTEEQRSQPAVCSKTLRAAGLLSVGRVGSVVTAHYGDAPPSPPCPQPKSLAAAPLAIFRQTLKWFGEFGKSFPGATLMLHISKSEEKLQYSKFDISAVSDH
jgi:hypothetical protein